MRCWPKSSPAISLKVGLYTSPHLVRVEERIRVSGRMIPAKDFTRLLSSVRSRVELLLKQKKLEAHPTFFEVLTILAFLYFREKKVDIAVLETGMGGRFDATNVVTPLVSVITSISLDHQEHLGSTIARIAFEKAGIIKPGVPVVCGVEDSRALTVIGRKARMMRAPLVRPFGKDGRLESRKTRHGYRFIFKFHDEEFRYVPSLAGAHQGSNAAIAIAAAGIISRTWRPLRKKLVIDGVERARWEGRLETVGRNPAILLDGAHNEAGALLLKTFIRDRCRPKPILIFAVMKDKAIPRMVRILFPEAQKVFLPALSYPRAASPEDILSLARPFRKRIQVVPALKDVIAAARAEAGFRGTVLITGSLILVGEAKKIFGRTAPVSAPAPSGTSPVGSPRRKTDGSPLRYGGLWADSGAVSNQANGNVSKPNVSPDFLAEKRRNS